jgi:hypothetical protein
LDRQGFSCSIFPSASRVESTVHQLESALFTLLPPAEALHEEFGLLVRSCHPAADPALLFCVALLGLVSSLPLAPSALFPACEPRPPLPARSKARPWQISWCDSVFLLWFEILQVEVSIVFESPDQKTQTFQVPVVSCGGFSNTPVKCSIKYEKDIELLYLFNFVCHSCALIFAHIK